MEVSIWWVIGIYFFAGLGHLVWWDEPTKDGPDALLAFIIFGLFWPLAVITTLISAVVRK